MTQHLAAVTIVVRDYDEAIAYYTAVLGFELREDTALPGGKRWVRVAPRGSEASLLLAVARDDAQRAAIGRGVRFIEAPRDEAYGRVVVFEDLYGNRWDLVQPRAITDSR
jgi:catechol 2,3-dioxygenase-like lactoylglutathione lyase family enzyme